MTRPEERRQTEMMCRLSNNLLLDLQ